MRIAFVDYTPWNYGIQTAYEAPLGGSQSALCYLAEALAREGHEVALLNQCATPGVSRGVQCVRLADPVSADWLRSLDALVIINTAGRGQDFRARLGRH